MNPIKKYLLFLLAILFFCPSDTGIYAQDSTIIWNKQRLEKVRQRAFDGDPLYKYGYDRLLREADAEKEKSNPTVMDKKMTPPSGDKHDYMSIGRYWWPDPAKPDGLPYIRKDGHSNPELKEFDRERLGEFSTSVTKLTLAYCLGGNGEYARKAVSLLRTWFVNPKTRMNPNMNFGQTIPGRDEGRGRPEGVLDTYSLVPVVDALIILEEGKYISRKDAEVIRKWFGDYVEWMTTSPIGIGEQNALNNHAVAYDVQLTVFSLYAGRKDIAMKVIEEFPARRLAAQIDHEGKQPRELARATAFGYSVFNLTHIMDMVEAAGSVGIELYPAADNAVKRAIEYLIPYLGNETSFPYEQISNWSGVETSLSQVLYRASYYDQKERYRSLYEKYNGNRTKEYLFTLLYAE